MSIYQQLCSKPHYSPKSNTLEIKHAALQRKGNCVISLGFSNRSYSIFQVLAK